MDDLQKRGELLQIEAELDPGLEMAEVHRRIFEQGGPAIHYTRVKGSPFESLSNLYGTFSRTEYIFRDSIETIRKLGALKSDPSAVLKNPAGNLRVMWSAIAALPVKARFRRPSIAHQTAIDQLPKIKSWPDDGGPFITLPQVITFPPGSRKVMRSNVGMYRIQLSGNDYVPGEVGLHYQIHRGIGNHHQLYNKSDEPFRAVIAVGGPPGNTLAAILPAPENMSELTFAGLLNGHRYRYFWRGPYFIPSDADFIITGTIDKNLKKPEGPFGDHLGYYSLQHDFPVMHVDGVFHRPNPVWHFTVVGRPPQEDSSFGHVIHLMLNEVLPYEFPGLVELNAVDAAGVHPLLLAIGKERYMPFREQKPEEILTVANHLLGKGQTSLAKYLWIAADDGEGCPSTRDIPAFLTHVLQRVDWKRDLHFQTQTTMDTLDYSGHGWNAGSKVVIACRGSVLRRLCDKLPEGLSLPAGFSDARWAMPGIILVRGPEYKDYQNAEEELGRLCDEVGDNDLSKVALIVVADDPSFVAASLNNFLWVTFTRSNPAEDVYGVGSFIERKHWGCEGPLVIDARIKPHHAPVLTVDEATKRRVDRLFSKGGELHGLFPKMHPVS